MGKKVKNSFFNLVVNEVVAIIMTPLSALWRLLNVICDWRSYLRRLAGLSRFDVIYVVNMRDKTDRNVFLGKWRPKSGHFAGPRFILNNRFLGRTRSIDMTSNDMSTKEGQEKARNLFIKAAAWGHKRGARVCLLANDTKHLFDDPVNGNGYELKHRFPDMIFTIGDNGTFFLMGKETIRALEKSRLQKNARIAVLGGYGVLGEQSIKNLMAHGYKNLVAVGRKKHKLLALKETYGIDICETLEEVGKVNAVIACTHGLPIKADNLHLLRKDDADLLVVDVAEPSNFKRKEWKKVRSKVVRQDAGNAFNKRLKYVLGAISYKMFRLTRGVQFGCFAEAMSIVSALERGVQEDLRKIDFFKVNSENIELIERFFKIDGYTVPSPRSHGKLVKSFALTYKESKKMAKKEAVAKMKDGVRDLKLVSMKLEDGKLAIIGGEGRQRFRVQFSVEELEN